MLTAAARDGGPVWAAPGRGAALGTASFASFTRFVCQTKRWRPYHRGGAVRGERYGDCSAQPPSSPAAKIVTGDDKTVRL